jgi:hypothetical protein
MQRLPRLAFSVVLPVVLQVVLLSQARADIFVPPGYEGFNYDVTLDGGITGVTNIVLLDQFTTPSGENFSATYPYTVSSGSSSIGIAFKLNAPITGTMAIGLADGVPGDPNPTLAVFGDFTSSQIGESFSTLFPGVDESTMISNLMNVSRTSFPSELLASLLPLTLTDAENQGILIPHSNSNSNFDVVAFSNGQLIGTGTLDVTVATPEPSSLSLLLLASVLFAAVRLFPRLNPSAARRCN